MKRERIVLIVSRSLSAGRRSGVRVPHNGRLAYRDGRVILPEPSKVLRRQEKNELEPAILDKALQRTADSQITVADLTGVAVQDIQISKAVYQILKSGPPSG